MKQKTIFSGYVARHQNGQLCLFTNKPIRDSYDNSDGTQSGFWNCDIESGELGLPPSAFPLVTWSSEPKRVKIEIEEFE